MLRAIVWTLRATFVGLFALGARQGQGAERPVAAADGDPGGAQGARQRCAPRHDCGGSVAETRGVLTLRPSSPDKPYDPTTLKPHRS
eukprot:157372-Prorocentrum_minimum.AAC.1